MKESETKHLKVKVYTDGACSGNPGPGGWAALLIIKSDKAKEKILLKGGEKHTTNNRMELIAIAESLEFIKKNFNKFESEVRVYSDSSYAVSSVNSGSLSKWMINGWKTSKDTDVSNKDIWERIVEVVKHFNPTLIKVKGHSGHKHNDYVDKKAVAECDKYKKLLESL